MIRIFNCIICEKEKRISESKNRIGRTICCSRKCADKYHSIMMKGRTDIIKHILKEEIKIPREKIKLAYLAGFIDGGGCLRINKEKRVEITITNTDLEVISWIKEEFGGRITTQDRKEYGWKICYKVEIKKTKDVFKLLNALLPYLITKRKKAEKLIIRATEIIKRYENKREK